MINLPTLVHNPYFNHADNDDKYIRHPQRVRDIFNSSRVTPDVIILGTVNGDSRTFEHRAREYKTWFPSAHVLDFSGRRLPDGCKADFQNCLDTVGGHTCVPGPIARVAERFMRGILLITNV